MKGNLADFKNKVEHTIKDVLRNEYLSDIAHAIGYIPQEKANSRQSRVNDQNELEMEGR